LLYHLHPEPKPSASVSGQSSYMVESGWQLHLPILCPISMPVRSSIISAMIKSDGCQWRISSRKTVIPETRNISK
jgi:hypothetical protein